MSMPLPLGAKVHGSSLVCMPGGVIGIRDVRGAAEAIPDGKDTVTKRVG